MATLNLVKKSDCFRFLFVTIVLLFVFFFLSALFFILIFLIYYLFICFSSPITLFLGVFEVERSEVVVAVKTSRSETGRTLLLFCLFVCFCFFLFFCFFLILQFCKAFLFFFSYACLSVCLYVCNISFFDIIKVGHLQNV